jgi:hypothetical protein
MAKFRPVEAWVEFAVQSWRTPASMLLNAVAAVMLLGSQAAVPPANATGVQAHGNKQAQYHCGDGEDKLYTTC